MKKLTLLSVLVVLLLVLIALTPTLSASDKNDNDNDGATTAPPLRNKLVAMVTTFLAGLMGIALTSFDPSLDRQSQTMHAVIIIYKAFDAGAILAVAFVHLLPDAYVKLTSPCLGTKYPWAQFPTLNLIIVAVYAAVVTLTLEFVAQTYLAPGLDSQRTNVGDEEQKPTKDPKTPLLGEPRLLSPFSKVLEVGIWSCIGFSSVVIGFSLGASQSDDAVPFLSSALIFHQTFKYTGLLTCLPRSPKRLATSVIAIFYYSLTTPVGIAVGIGASRIYTGNSAPSLILQGVSNAAAAGILIYHSVVHMMVSEFVVSKVKKSVRIQVMACAAFLFGCYVFTFGGTFKPS